MADPKQHDWENHRVFGWNKEAPHSFFIPFGDVESALKNDPSQSPYYLLLNGTWKFHWAKNPADRPKDFFTIDFDPSSWSDIEVPGNWEVQGFGIPIYIESGYPFKATPPQVSDEWNPVGSYRRTFVIPKEWEHREIFLHFGAVKSAVYVWINGKEVGYSQGTG